MIKVSVLYPNSEGSHFDTQYYCEKHTPMVTQLYGSLCKNVSVDIGIPLDMPNMPVQEKAFHAIGSYVFNSIEDFGLAMASNAEEIMKDAINYTNIQPVIQVSEIIILEKN